MSLSRITPSPVAELPRRRARTARCARRRPPGGSVRGDRHGTGVEVRLDPPAAYALFGVPMHHLGNRVVALSGLPGPETSRREQRVPGARGRPHRFAALDSLPEDRMATGPRPSAALTPTWRTPRRAGGMSSMDEPVGDAGCSHRHPHLTREFGRLAGVTPAAAR